MKYTVTIEEVVSQEFEVETENIDAAMEIAAYKYRKGEFILSPGNLVCKQMCAETIDKKEMTEWVEF